MKPDPDLLVKAETRSGYEFEHYLYNSCNVNNMLCIHHSPDYFLNKLNGYILLKLGSFSSHDM